MSDHILLAELARFKGKSTNDCFDEIAAIARQLGYSPPLIKGWDSPPNIDSEPKRLNVRQDGNGVITSFSIG